MTTATTPAEQVRQGLEDLRRGNACATCGRLDLTTAWLGGEGRWAISCPTCGPDCVLAYDPEALDAYRRGDELTENQRASAERMLARIARREGVSTQALALTGDDQQIVTRILAKWPKDLEVRVNNDGHWETDKKGTDLAVREFLNVARELDLNPLMGEIIPFQGVIYIPNKGLLRKASEKNVLAGLHTRAARPDERRDQMADPTDHVWTCTVRLKDGSEFEAWGKVTAGEMTATTDKGKIRNPVLAAKPAEMAENRAIHDALERAGVLYLSETAFVTTGVRIVNTETGEIISGELQRELPADRPEDREEIPSDGDDENYEPPFAQPAEPSVRDSQVLDFILALEGASNASELKAIAESVPASDLTAEQQERIRKAYDAAKQRLGRKPDGRLI